MAVLSRQRREAHTSAINCHCRHERTQTTQPSRLRCRDRVSTVHRRRLRVGAAAALRVGRAACPRKRWHHRIGPTICVNAGQSDPGAAALLRDRGGI